MPTRLYGERSEFQQSLNERLPYGGYLSVYGAGKYPSIEYVSARPVCVGALARSGERPNLYLVAFPSGEDEPSWEGWLTRFRRRTRPPLGLSFEVLGASGEVSGVNAIILPYSAGGLADPANTYERAFPEGLRDGT